MEFNHKNTTYHNTNKSISKYRKNIIKNKIHFVRKVEILTIDNQDFFLMNIVDV